MLLSESSKTLGVLDLRDAMLYWLKLNFVDVPNGDSIGEISPPILVRLLLFSLLLSKVPN